MLCLFCFQETLQKNCGEKENLVMELEKQNTKKVFLIVLCYSEYTVSNK